MICHLCNFLCLTMNSFDLILLILVCVSFGALSAQAQIIGGTESAQSRWPFFAGLFYKRNEWVDAPYCGAVVWDKDTLLTAAHCVSSADIIDPNHPELFDVYIGHTSWTEPRDKEYMFKVREIIMHPYFRKEAPIFYDIALIFLDRSIDFNDINRKVQSVNDPEPLDYLDTSKCVAIGWGRDNENKKPTNLMEVVLPILDNEICNEENVDFDASHHLCAGYVCEKSGGTVAQGTCSGDSGGPLVCPLKSHPDKYSLVGIASYVKKPPDCSCHPSYFTNVELYEEWIARVHSKTSNVQTPLEMSWWGGFRKRWFEKLFSRNSHDDLSK